MKNLEFLSLYGSEAKVYVGDLSRLRIQVFREFPYLYDGNIAYEKNYLETYFSCSESFVVLCKDQNRIVGATTAIPLKFETVEVKKPFIVNNLDPGDFMYFGESILQHEYRGLGIGRRFFELRKAASHAGGYKRNCFCAVIRPDDHPLRPADFKNLDGLWQKMGFEKHSALKTKFKWQDIDEVSETEKNMQFWLSKA